MGERNAPLSLKDKTPWEKVITNLKMIVLIALHWFPANPKFDSFPYTVSITELRPALLSQAESCGKTGQLPEERGESRER